jgi:GGDEF domain-containing protein
MEPVSFIGRMTARFYDNASRLLTREAFGFMVDHHLRHAQRAQEFLTLVVFSAEREGQQIREAADESIVKELGKLISCAVRGTDLLARTADGMLSLLLIGVDHDRARQVIQRISQHVRRFGTSPVRLSVGAACCPTHASAAEDLMQRALAQRLTWKHGV